MGEENPPVRSPSPEIKDQETYTLFSMAGKTRPIVVTMSVNSKSIQMQVDTGASLSIISKETFNYNQTLQPTTIPLRTYTGECLTILGTIEVQVEHNSQSATLPVIVVEGDGPNLFEPNWYKKIRLNWSQICNITPNLSLEKVLEDYSNSFVKDLDVKIQQQLKFSSKHTCSIKIL